MMPFVFLLLILSLAIIIPTIFVVRAKRLSNSVTTTVTMKQTTINQIQQKSVNIDNLPKLFQQILKDIEAQFAIIYHKHQQHGIHHDSFHTAQRLFYVRLPEMVDDYLQLDSHYAKHQLIDIDKNLTSFDIMQQQLKSILNLFYQINQSSNELYLQNVLTNQRYLQALQQQTGFHSQLIQPNAPPLTNSTIVNSDMLTGQRYIEQFLPNQSSVFSDNFCQQLGELVYFASITQLAIHDEFQHFFVKNRMKADLQLEALAKLLQEQLPKSLHSALLLNNLTEYERPMLPFLQRLIGLLSDMLAILDTSLAVADKLALVQNLHDDFGEITDTFFTSSGID